VVAVCAKEALTKKSVYRAVKRVSFVKDDNFVVI
jgi:hypothetical protein